MHIWSFELDIWKFDLSLRRPHAEILEEEEEIAEDIEKADEYKALAYAAIIRAEKISTGAPTKTVSDESRDSAVTTTIKTCFHTEESSIIY